MDNKHKKFIMKQYMKMMEDFSYACDDSEDDSDDDSYKPIKKKSIKSKDSLSESEGEPSDEYIVEEEIEKPKEKIKHIQENSKTEMKLDSTIEQNIDKAIKIIDSLNLKELKDQARALDILDKSGGSKSSIKSNLKLAAIKKIATSQPKDRIKYLVSKYWTMKSESGVDIYLRPYDYKDLISTLDAINHSFKAKDLSNLSQALNLKGASKLRVDLLYTKVIEEIKKSTIGRLALSAEKIEYIDNKYKSRNILRHV